MENFGKVDIILDKYLKEHNISRSSLTRKTELQYSQILLQCDIQDILQLTRETEK